MIRIGSLWVQEGDREMADGKKEFWKDEVLEGGQRKLLG